MKSRIQRLLAVYVPLGIGAGAVAYMVSTGPEAPRRPVVETAYPLRVIATPELEFLPFAAGYGLTEADRTWRAVARVSGRLEELHPGMRSGGAINKGDLLVRIDPTDTEIAISSAKAELARLQSDLDQLEVEGKNNAAALEIESSALEVASAELARFQDLATKDAASAADVESRQRAELTQRQLVVSIESAQALIPGRRASLEAQRAGAQASLDDAERNRSFCEISAPFDAVIGEVALEVGQYVAAQESLFEIYDDARVRIDAALPQSEVLHILDAEARAQIALAINNPDRREELLGGIFEATVSAQVAGDTHSWSGRVVGARESLDAETRALRLTVVVEQSRESLFALGGPPLSRGAYCRVKISANLRTGVLAVPRSALRDGSVFVVDDSDRLARVEVDIEMTQGELAIVRTGLEAGMRVIVTPPSPAILGMLVNPMIDDDLMARMKSYAEGRSDD